MRTTGLRTLTLLLSALTLGLTFAHLLEMPKKLGWDAELWVRVQQSLYGYFGIVGGAVEVGAVVTAVVLAMLCARQGLPSAGARPAAALFVLGLAEWALVVRAANAQIGQWTVGAEPADWQRWRLQWEWGHAGHFLLWFTGFVVLLTGSVRAAAVRDDTVRDGAGNR